MEDLKKLNISVGKSPAEDVQVPAPAPDNSRSLAIIPPSGFSAKSAKKSSKAAKTSSKRGPASTKRKYSKKEEEEPSVSGRQLALTSSVIDFQPPEATEVSLNLSDDLAVESVLGDTSEELLSLTVDEDFMRGLDGPPDQNSKYDSLIARIENELVNVSQIRSEDDERNAQLEEGDTSERLLTE